MHQAARLGALGAITTLALAAGAALSPAHAGEGWVATRTQAHPVSASMVQGLAAQPGELLHVAVSLRMRNQAAMDALTSAILAGRSSRRIGSAEFLQQFAPTEVQAQAVVAHLAASGFVNIEVAKNRMLVTADGTAGSARAAFNTELAHYSVAGRDAYANVSDAQVPQHLGAIVNAVHGLQNVSRAQPMIAVPDASPLAKATTVGHKPTEFPAIYNASGLPPATHSTVAVIAEGLIAQTLTDLNAFASKAGYPAPAVSTVQVGAPGTDNAGLAEWNMDSQDALAAAGGQVKSMIFYVATSLDDAPLTAAYNQAVADNLAQAINVSLGECETAARSSGVTASDDAIFQIAVAQGQVFSVSSGDSGSRQCGGTANFTSYPAASPYVIAVGGTTLKTLNGAWSAETAWNGSGGGASSTESAPGWQTASGVLGTSTRRGVPDIAFDANPNSGALVLIKGKNQQYGGTSLAAPLFAGFWTRIQSANANGLVFPASALYSYGPGNPSLFHDVTTGNNKGFTAHAGWDDVTGFGSLDVGAFAAFVATHPGF